MLIIKPETRVGIFSSNGKESTSWLKSCTTRVDENITWKPDIVRPIRSNNCWHKVIKLYHTYIACTWINLEGSCLRLDEFFIKPYTINILCFDIQGHYDPAFSAHILACITLLRVIKRSCMESRLALPFID